MPTEGKCENAGQNPAVLFMKGLAYPWLWVGKQVHVVKQETIDDFYSPTWGLPGSSVPGSSASNKGIDVGSE